MTLMKAMKARDVVGHTIVAIRQRRVRRRPTRDGGLDLEAIILDDGREIRFIACETEDLQYRVGGIVVFKPVPGLREV